MRPARLGAVSYLNTKPLVRGLHERPDLFTVRFDVPSVCASLLHAGRVDLGLIPAIEYLRGDYAIVPGIAIGSDGPVDSVTIFTTVPIERVRTLALDVSSRTSVVLTRILCRKLWAIAPVSCRRSRTCAPCWRGPMPRWSLATRPSTSNRDGRGDEGRPRAAWQALTGLALRLRRVGRTMRRGGRRAGGRATGGPRTRRAGGGCHRP